MKTINTNKFVYALLVLVPILAYIFLASFSSKLEGIPEAEKGFYTCCGGYIYPSSVDGYLFYKQALDLSEGKEVKNPSLLPYLENSVLSLGKIFNPEFSLMAAIFYLPLIFGVVSIILIFLLAKKAFGPAAGFIASFLFAVHFSLISIFKAGYSDTGPLNIMLSLFFMLFLLKSVESFREGSKKQGAIFAVLALLSLVVFKLAWSGYYYILIITSAFFAVYILARLYSKKDYRKMALFALAVAAVVLFCGILFSGQILNSKLYTYLFKPEITGIYPDWSSQIKELRSSDWGSFIGALGWPVAVAALAGVFFSFTEMKNFSRKNKKTLFQIYLIVFLAFSAAGMVFAVRTAPFLVLASVIFAAGGICGLCNSVSGFFQKASRKKAGFACGAIILALFLVFLLPKAWSEANAPPLMDSSVYETAMMINANSSNDAAITSWWDEGHFYRAFANRKVSVEGNPDAKKMYLIARALSTDNESLSAGIFRILNCGKTAKDLAASNIYAAVSKNKCTPSEHFLVLSSWAKKYSDSIFFMGNWNFSANKSDFDISRPPIGDFSQCSLQGERLRCGKYSVDVLKSEAYYNGTPISFVYPIKSGFGAKDRDTAYALILYPVGNGYESAAVRKEILNSVFVRLYFMNGYGLKHFSKFSEIVKAKRTMAYRINWQSS